MTDIDELMDRDPLDLTSDDIEALITQQRKYRSAREAGTFKSVRKPTASAPAIDLKALGLVKEADPVKRRF